jgi:predicted transcriptional regulator
MPSTDLTHAPPASQRLVLSGTRALLPRWSRRVTLSYMKNASVTIRLDPKLQRELSRLSRQLGRSRSDLVRDALRRQLALVRFEQVRRGLLPLAEAKGILSDEDVFDFVS